MLVRFALFLITVLSARQEALMDYEEEVGRSDSALPAREAQPVVSQAETRMPTGVFRHFTSMRGRSDIDHSQHNVIDQSTQQGQSLSQAEAQIRAYFLTIAEISLA